MDGLERVRRAIHFQGPDCLPHFLADGGPNDIVWLWPPRPVTGLATDWYEIDGGRWRRYDEWGTRWERFGPSGNGEAVAPALADWSRLDDVIALLATPPPLAPMREIQAAIAAELAGGVECRYWLGVLQYPSLYETGHGLRTVAPFLADLYEHPAEVERLLDRLMASQMLCIDLFADAGVHGVMWYDDWGMQDRTFISPRLFDRYFAPRYRALWEHAHDRGLDVWMHSCGYILPFLPRMVDCGLNVIQMDQQENMGLAALDRAMGGSLAFWCPVDIQNTMITGSEADIERYVQRMIYHLGRHRGGLVSKTYPSPQDVHHTPEMVAAACRAFRKWGAYPLADEVLAVGRS
jgi:uroporphyrinogen decarboxylase